MVPAPVKANNRTKQYWENMEYLSGPPSQWLQAGTNKTSMRMGRIIILVGHEMARIANKDIMVYKESSFSEEDRNY